MVLQSPNREGWYTGPDLGRDGTSVPKGGKVVRSPTREGQYSGLQLGRVGNFVFYKGGAVLRSPTREEQHSNQSENPES